MVPDDPHSGSSSVRTVCFVTGVLLIGVLGCSDGAEDLPSNGGQPTSSFGGTATNASRDVPPDTVPDAGDTSISTLQGTFILERMLTTDGNTVEGMTLETGEQTTSTDGSGEGRLRLPNNARFTIRMAKEMYLDHRLIGRSGSVDFTYEIPVASRASLEEVFTQAAQVTLDSRLGVLVVALETEEGEPLTGARVGLDAETSSSQPITIGTNGQPEPDTTINVNERSTVLFPNVETGPLSLTIETPGEETCRLAPGGEDNPEISVQANTVTVVVLRCR